MSARQILQRNKQRLKIKQIINQLSNAKIRTFLDSSGLDLLSEPSLRISLILNPAKKQKVEKLRFLVALKNSVYLTDVQFEDYYSFCVIHNNPRQDKWFSSEHYTNYKDYSIYLNPKIKQASGTQLSGWQKCNSFPFFKCQVNRADKIIAQYTKLLNVDKDNEKPILEDVQQNMQGFKARVFQHCVDHVQGINFLTPTLCRGRLGFQFNEQHFANTRFLIKEYNLRVKKALQQNSDTQKTRAQYSKRIRQQYIKQADIAKQWSIKNKAPIQLLDNLNK